MVSKNGETLQKDNHQYITPPIKDFMVVWLKCMTIRLASNLNSSVMVLSLNTVEAWACCGDVVVEFDIFVCLFVADDHKANRDRGNAKCKEQKAILNENFYQWA